MSVIEKAKRAFWMELLEKVKWAFWMELQPKLRRVARNTKYMSVHVLGGERRVLERET
jgi:hypothetical protein